MNVFCSNTNKDEMKSCFIKRMNIFSECTVAIVVTLVIPENFLRRRITETVKIVIKI